MKKIISPLLKYGIPVALSVLLVWFFYKNMDMEAIKQSLREDVNFWWFVPVIVVSIFSHVFRACRWRLQLRALGIDAPLSALVNSIFGTYFVNLLAPRLGEVWRSGYIASRERTSFSKVVGSMVGDRLSDTLTVLALTIVTFFLAQGAFMKFLSQKGAASGESMFATWWFWALVAVGADGVGFQDQERKQGIDQNSPHAHQPVGRLDFNHEDEGKMVVPALHITDLGLLFLPTLYRLYGVHIHQRFGHCGYTGAVCVQQFGYGGAYQWRCGRMAIRHHVRACHLRRGRTAVGRPLQSPSQCFRMDGVAGAASAAGGARHLRVCVDGD